MDFSTKKACTYQAVILVGGLGKRLGHRTKDTPKPMVDVGGRPFLEIKLEYLRRQGITDIVLCVGHLGKIIEDYFQDGSRFGLTIKYSYEEELLGTAGALKNAERFIERDFIAMNGDVFHDLDVSQLIEFHESRKKLMTMVVGPSTNPTQQELVEIKDNLISRFHKRDTVEHRDHLERNNLPLINGGVYVMNRKLLEYIPGGRNISIESEIFPKLVSEMAAYLYEGYFVDIGTPRDYEKFKRDIEQRKKITYNSRAPVRITFGGGGTDISPYDENYGGLCLGATIDKYVYVSLTKRTDQKIVLKSSAGEREQEFSTIEAVSYNGELDLIKAVIKKMRPNFGMELYIKSEIPHHSGLGASASVSVAVIGLFNYFRKKDRLTDHQISELAYVVEEEELQNKGGRQDHYAAVFGGINLYEFNGQNFVLVNPTKAKQDSLFELEKNLLLVRTKHRTKSSGEIHQEEKEQNLYTKESKITFLHDLKRIALEMDFCLREGDLEKFGELIRIGWEKKKLFNPKVTTPYIDELISAGLEQGAIGSRLMGAGGGGHLLFYCKPNKKETIASTLEELGAKIIPFSFDTKGLQIWESHQ